MLKILFCLRFYPNVDTIGLNTGNTHRMYSLHPSYPGATTLKPNTFHQTEPGPWRYRAKHHWRWIWCAQESILEDYTVHGFHFHTPQDHLSATLRRTMSQFPQSETGRRDVCVLTKLVICSCSDMEGWTLDWLVMKPAEVYIHFHTPWPEKCQSAAMPGFCPLEDDLTYRVSAENR